MTVQRPITPQITTNLSRVEASHREREELGYETHHRLDLTLSDCEITSVEWDDGDDAVLIKFLTRSDIDHNKHHEHRWGQWLFVARLEDVTDYVRQCVWGKCQVTEEVSIPND